MRNPRSAYRLQFRFSNHEVYKLEYDPEGFYAHPAVYDATAAGVSGMYKVNTVTCSGDRLASSGFPLLPSARMYPSEDDDYCSTDTGPSGPADMAYELITLISLA